MKSLFERRRWSPLLDSWIFSSYNYHVMLLYVEVLLDIHRKAAQNVVFPSVMSGKPELPSDNGGVMAGMEGAGGSVPPQAEHLHPAARCHMIPFRSLNAQWASWLIYQEKTICCVTAWIHTHTAESHTMTLWFGWFLCDIYSLFITIINVPNGRC